MDKSVVRREARKKRQALGAQYRQKASSEIVEQLISRATQHTAIHSFEPMLDKNEVDIREFNAWVASQPDKTLYIQDLTGNFPNQKFDMVVVPGLVFDEHGNRIGYGGGHYDRFLRDQPSAYKVGVCFRLLVSKEYLPQESHDIPIDTVIKDQ